MPSPPTATVRAVQQVEDEAESSHNSSSENETPEPALAGGGSKKGASNSNDGGEVKKVSCQPCREAKVKCIPSSNPSGSCSVGGNAAPCSRCIKLERTCFYRTHKRGRKPGKIKLQQILRRLELLDRTLVEIKELNKEVGDADANSLIETLMWQLHRSKFFSNGNIDNKVDTGAGKGKGKGEVKEEESSPLAEGASGTPTIGPGTGAMGLGGMRKGRSDFNMLVDMEDHASVARVPDEFPTLSNPLKLLAQASSEESERRREMRSLRRFGQQRESGLRRQTSYDPDHHAGGGGTSSEGEVGEERRASSQPRLSDNPDRPSSRKRPRSRSRSRSRSPSAPRSSTTTTISRGGGQSSTQTQPHDTDTSRGLTKGLNPPTTTTSNTGGASSWASTYFSRGAFHPVYDNRPEFDPIDQQLLTPHQATRLINSFYASFGTFMHILDPTLSTITYIRKHSAFLLTVICALSAEFEASSSPPSIQAESAHLAVTLRRHYEGMMAWILSGDYKNVEMAQAFFLLASYRPMSDSAMSDQTWLFLGTAIRIATELGCNLVCYSYGTTGGRERDVGEGKEQEHYQRQLRNTERLWINLWNLEKTLASQTGQRMHLADEGVIATCSRWHRMPVALRQDEALVAQVELRRVMIAQGDHFNTHVLRSLGARRRVAGFTNGAGIDQRKSRLEKGEREGGGDDGEEEEEGEEGVQSMAERDQLSLQLSYFRNSVTMDLKRWEERWLSAHSTCSSSSSSTCRPTPLQITGPLTLDYAALVTYALPLPISYTVDVTPELAQLYRHCYISCTNYMATFIDRSQRGFMDHVTNSIVVSTVYAVVFALDLARKQQMQERREGGGERKRAGVDFGFVSRKRVLNLARLTARELDKIGEARRGRVGRSIASKYSVFLRGVLGRFEEGRSDGASGGEDDREGEGEEERMAVQRGFNSNMGGSHEAEAEVSRSGEGRHLRRDHNHPLQSRGGEGRHLRRDHNHALPQQSSLPLEGAIGYTAPAPAPASASAGKPGTRASHTYSSNIHFSPLTQHSHAPGPSASTYQPPPSNYASVSGGGWSARIPTPTPHTTAASSGSGSGAGAWGRYIPPPHHNTHQPQQQNFAPAPTADADPAIGVLSPASWFHTTTGNAPVAATTTTTAAAAAGGGATLEEDPSWEWMMKDLDFFNVDGGGGGGEPILDQMGRLFG